MNKVKLFFKQIIRTIVRFAIKLYFVVRSFLSRSQYQEVKKEQYSEISANDQG